MINALKRLLDWWSVKPKKNSTDLETPTGVSVSETPEGILYQTLVSGICPDCNRASKFYVGPSGGASTNIQCEDGHWFNVTTMIGIASRIRR